MTLGEEYALFVFALPLALLLGMFLAHMVEKRRLSAGIRGQNRPMVNLFGKRCRVVTEEEFNFLHKWGHLEWED